MSHQTPKKTKLYKIKKIIILSVFFCVLYLILLYKVYYLINSPWNALFRIYSLLTGVFLFSRFIISYFYSDKHNHQYSPGLYPKCSFVISCKNEEDSISKTIDTCLTSIYPNELDCIAINDGSTDNTLSQMKESKRKWGSKLRIISFSENRGKREGMSEGVLASKNDIIIFVDSDSFVRPEAVKIIVEHFIEDPQIGAVSGNTRVENDGVNMLTKMQSARYGISYDIFKASESVFGTVTCCPGCFSAYKRKAILKVLRKWRFQTFLGSRSTFGDDRSLTNFVMRTRKVVYCRSAIATTIVPERFKKLFNQQLRWKKSWIREGIANTGSFIWRKNPVASLSFYINLLIPIFGPIIIVKVLLVDFATHGTLPLYYVFGIVAMSLLFGIYYYAIYPNKYWWYVLIFSLLYTFVLIWQMPYALIKLRDTKWGTR